MFYLHVLLRKCWKVVCDSAYKQPLAGMLEPFHMHLRLSQGPSDPVTLAQGEGREGMEQGSDGMRLAVLVCIIS